MKTGYNLLQARPCSGARSSASIWLNANCDHFNIIDSGKGVRSNRIACPGKPITHHILRRFLTSRNRWGVACGILPSLCSAITNTLFMVAPFQYRVNNALSFGTSFTMIPGFFLGG